jgi:hypothetical protein
MFVVGEPLSTQPARPVVYVVPIAGIIVLGLAPFVQRTLGEAAGADAAAVILEINTFGGRVDAAVLIRDALLQARVRTVAFVNKRAISAGALISLAAETIAMANGGTSGAATPVTLGAPRAPAQPMAEKTVSYMRKEFHATAEARKRQPLLAEAIVDADVEIPGVIDKGKLLTLTTEEALQHKVADVRANSIEAVLTALDLADAEVRLASQTWAETLVRFLTHPVVSSLRLTLHVLSKGLDAGTAYEILSIDIADVDVGENIGAKLQIDQANADKQIAQAKAEERRAMAVAVEQEMRARVVEAEAEVPRAMAEAFRQGNLGLMDYYRMKNIQADTTMREAIAGTGEEPTAGPKTERRR